MKALLDTNVLLRLHLAPGKIGNRSKVAFEGAQGLYYSPLSVFELLQTEAVPVHLVGDFVEATQATGIQELQLSTRAASEARAFGNLRGRDPLDLLILAQAAEAGMYFYTSDMELLELGLDFVRDSSL